MTAWIFLLIALAGLAALWFARRRSFTDKLFRQKAALERAAMEEHFRQVMRFARDPTFLHDAEGRIIEANERAESVYGYPREVLIGKHVAELRAPESRAALARDEREVERHGELTYETVHQRADGSTFPVEISGRHFEIDGRGYFHAVVRDISERKSAEARIQTLNRLYRTLWQTNEALVRSNSRDEVMREICRIAVEESGLSGAWISMVDKASGKVLPLAMSRGLEHYLAHADITIDADDPRGQGPIGRAIREGRPVIIEDFMHDPALEPWRGQAAGLSVVTSAAFPLRIEGKIVGTLSFHASSAGFFDAEVVQLLDQTARDVGYALERFAENERRREAERRLADSEEQFKQAFESASIGIALIGTDGNIVKTNASSSSISGYSDAELIGKQFRDFLAPESVVPLMTQFAQLLSGERRTLRTEAQIVRKDGRPAWVRANAARVCDSAGKLRYLVVQVEDISEYKASGERVRQYMEELEETMTGTIRAISTMVEIRDPYTAGHELRVGRLAAAIAGEMGLDPERCRGLDVAGSLHDIGKISVPAEILSKPTRLQPAEYEIVKTHAQSGYDILKDIRFPWPIAEVARQHHERLDGSGYPQGLKDGQIILEARILAVADVVESMGSHRPYRPARGIDAALEEIANGRGRLYDADAVDACLRLFREKGYRLPA
ncbi:MAG TPA: PAS domain S-box protein [Burkholderiales bacterium]|nr:PAS domain S-box protein [Burkholderiales bacterium]